MATATAPARPVSAKYRPDIDGLRAIAVLSVVVYHAFPGWLPGGFLGVDVFFVISGYLISTILLEGLDKGSFSLPDFYGRRIRRIFPALLLVLAASYAFGWFVLLADEYRELGKHVAAGAGFVSNLVLWGEAGYFDRSADSKPLLHLWSLGVEEQFYIAWPLLLWLTWKRRFAGAAIAAVAVLSLLTAATWGKANPVGAFYSPVTRFWELLAGSLLAWLSLRGRPLAIPRSWSAAAVPGTPRDALSWVGLGLLAFAFACVQGGRDPAVTAGAIAVAGAIAIIAAGAGAWPNRWLLSNRLAVGLGLASFSLYLWHWPLLSFARILVGQAPDAALAAAVIAVALLLAWATYHLVEVPVRFGPHRRAKVAACAVLMLAVCALGRWTYDLDGLRDREVVALNEALWNGDAGWTRGQSDEACDIADPSHRDLFAHCARDRRGNVRYAVLGDSKGVELYGGLVRTSTAAGRWMFIGGFGEHGAPIPLWSDDPALAHFQRLTRTAIEAIAGNEHVEKVVVAAAVPHLFQLGHRRNGKVDHRYLDRLQDTQHYGRTLEGLSATVSVLAAKGKQVILLVDNPAFPHPRDCLGRRAAWNLFDRLRAPHADCVVPLERFEAQIAIYRKLLAELLQRHPGAVEIFDATDIYCDRTRGVCEPTREGRLMYSDQDHISGYAAGLIGARINRLLAGEGDGAHGPRDEPERTGARLAGLSGMGGPR